ncbi:MAG: hypothetical protein Q4G04_02175 [bacterium]|nr:hypothetical protein [bacterium]
MAFLLAKNFLISSLQTSADNPPPNTPYVNSDAAGGIPKANAPVALKTNVIPANIAPIFNAFLIILAVLFLFFLAYFS